MATQTGTKLRLAPHIGARGAYLNEGVDAAKLVHLVAMPKVDGEVCAGDLRKASLH